MVAGLGAGQVAYLGLPSFFGSLWQSSWGIGRGYDHDDTNFRIQNVEQIHWECPGQIRTK